MTYTSLKQKLYTNTSSRLQTLLAKEALYDTESGMLIIDLSRFHPGLRPVALPNWDQMLTLKHEPVLWPTWPILHWPAYPATVHWKQHIPSWVHETILRFPKRNHLPVLHLCAKYPQMLELLEKMPLLVWKIADKHLDEHTLKSLFQQPRIYLTEAVNWGSQKEAVRFLQKLRLRSMDTPIIQHVEQCLSQPQLLKQACHLPRINSMALTIAAQFPQFIDTPLHHSLARQPCRPEQCKQLHATLSDTLALAQWLNKPLSMIKKCRFEIEIEEVYREWLSESLKKQLTSHHQATTFAQNAKSISTLNWTLISPKNMYHACQQTGHAWFIELKKGYQLYQHQKYPLIAALHPQHITIARQAHNKLPSTEQLAEIALLEAAIKTSTS